MTSLRQRMLEDLKLRGLSESTQEVYVRAVRQLAEHYGRPPIRSPTKNCASTFSISRMSEGLLRTPSRLT